MDYYFIGSIIPFVFENEKMEDEFMIHNRYCSLSYLYKIRDRYQEFFCKRIYNVSYVSNEPYSAFFISKINKKTILDKITGITEISEESIFIPFFQDSSEFIWSFDPAYKWDFIAGIVDSFSIIRLKNDDVQLIIPCNYSLCQIVKKLINLPYIEDDEGLKYEFTNVIDLFGLLKNSLKKSDFNLINNLNYPLHKFYVYKRDPLAIIPKKARESDVGYDISIIKKHKKFNQTTTLYDTGIALKIPLGYYVEIVPRSSLSKSGYILSNSVGIIDRSYTGNLYISLTKIAEDAIDIESNLPFKCCQLIFKKQCFLELQVEENENEFSESSRGKGGFGSTG